MWGQVRVVEPGSGLWSLPVCLDVRACLGTGTGVWGEAAASVRRRCARLRDAQNCDHVVSSWIVVVSVRVRGEYIYTLSISRPRPHVILLHTPDAETTARRHTPRGRIPHPTRTQQRYHANGAHTQRRDTLAAPAVRSAVTEYRIRKYAICVRDRDRDRSSQTIFLRFRLSVYAVCVMK